MNLAYTVLAARQLTCMMLLEPPVWPDGTLILPTDVVIGGESLAGQARGGTPAVRIGEQHTAGEPGQHFVTVVMTTVLDVTPACRTDGHPRIGVIVDAELDGCAAHYGALRLIGRGCTSRLAAADLGAPGAGTVRVRLPRDVRAGDLLAVPCDGIRSPSMLRARPRGHIVVE